MTKRKDRSRPVRGKVAGKGGGAVPAANRGRALGDAPGDWDPNAPVVVPDRYVPPPEVHTGALRARQLEEHLGKDAEDAAAWLVEEQARSPLTGAGDTAGTDRLVRDAAARLAAEDAANEALDALPVQRGRQASTYSDVEREALALMGRKQKLPPPSDPLAEASEADVREHTLEWAAGVKTATTFADGREQARALSAAGARPQTWDEMTADREKRRTVIGEELTPMLGGGSPRVAQAQDVAALRSWLVRQWQPGGAYYRTAYLQAGRAPGPSVDPDGRWYAESERVLLQRASLWWVAPPMVDLLASVAPSTPADALGRELPCPSDAGLVVLAKPIFGSDAQSGGLVQLDAFAWTRSVLSEPGYRDGAKLRCFSISSYRRLIFDDGMTGPELALASETGALAHGNPGRVERGADGETVYSIHGETWVPLGRSDWPVDDRLDEKLWPEATDEFHASAVEDRRLLTSLWTLLEQRGVAERQTVVPDRATRRRAVRAGVAADASDVVVVTLRRPKPAPHVLDGSPAPPVERSHRWLVKEHLRWQACGPGRKERRLTLVQAHVKGPADKPLVLKTRVNSWVR